MTAERSDIYPEEGPCTCHAFGQCGEHSITCPAWGSEWPEETEVCEKMHRDFCPRCAVKHLGKAAILMKEAKLGYPHHIWYAMANMSEAEDEIVDRMPEEAEQIRAERIKIQDTLAKSEGKEKYVPDFTKLMYLVGKNGLLEETFDVEIETEI